MAALLAKFRIDFSSVLVIPGKNIIQFKITFYLTLLLDVTKRASEESRTKLNAKLAELPAGTIPEVNLPHSPQDKHDLVPGEADHNADVDDNDYRA